MLAGRYCIGDALSISNCWHATAIEIVSTLQFYYHLWCYRTLVLYLASVLDEARSFLSKYSKRRLGG